MLMASVAAVSCTDGNDWETDSTYDRLFSTSESNISVSAAASEAEVKWNTVKEAEYYVIEISTDSLYNEVAMGGANAIVFGEDKTVTASPYTLAGLSPDTKYFLRIKAMSSAKAESKWSYYTDKSFKTKTEQIINDYDAVWNGISLKWTANAVVDRLEITDDSGAVVQTITLSAADIAAGSYSVEGLTPLTSYQVVLYNGTAKRGVVDFTTPAKVPDAEQVIYLAATDSLNNTLLEEVAAAGKKSVTLALPAGSAYYNASTLTIPDGLSVNFFGISGGEQPILAIAKLDIAGAHDAITFENLNISADGKDETGADKTTEYFINQSAACEVGTIEFSNCLLDGFVNTPFRLQGNDAKVVNSLTFTNCLIYTSNQDKYAVINVDAGSGKGVVNNMKFSNTTVAGTSKGFITSKNTDFDSLVIENCTFSGILNSGRYFFDCNSTNYGPTTFTITNTIIGSVVEGSKGARSKTDPTITDSYQTASAVFASNAINGFGTYEKAETSLFKDAANYDFTIIDNSFAGKKNCGDPRWYYAD